MDTYIALLRGINVSGQKAIRMEALRALFESLGYSKVKSYIQSGNMVFEAGPGEHQQTIEAAVASKFGFEVPVQIRDAKALDAIVQSNPFLSGSGIDQSKLHVAFLDAEPDKAGVERLSAVQSGRDEFMLQGREVYLHCPDGYGRSKLTNITLEKKLGQLATTRNWKTVLQLQKMAHEV